MKYEKEFRKAFPETIGETDRAYDESNYTDFLESLVEAQNTIDNKAMLQSLCGSCKKKRGCRCHYKFGVEAIKCKYYD